MHPKLRLKAFKFAFCLLHDTHTHTHTHTQKLKFQRAFPFPNIDGQICCCLLISFYLLMCFQTLYCHFSGLWGRSQVHTTKFNQKLHYQLLIPLKIQNIPCCHEEIRLICHSIYKYLSRNSHTIWKIMS